LLSQAAHEGIFAMRLPQENSAAVDGPEAAHHVPLIEKALAATTAEERDQAL
jgi:hypothetical protein